MLLPKDIHPKDSLYYNGGVIIDTLKRFDEIELIDLFYETKKKIEMMKHQPSQPKPLAIMLVKQQY